MRLIDPQMQILRVGFRRYLSRSFILKASILTVLITSSLASCALQGRDRSIGEQTFIRHTTQLQPAQLQTDEKLQAVATTNLVFDTLLNVGGELIDLQLLIPRGADPHAYDPSPGDLRKLVDADIVFISGVDLEAALHPALSEIAAETAIISISEGVELRSFSDSEPAGADPHVWMDPLNVQIWAANAATALAAADPEHASHYKQNAEQYTQSLERLHNWIVEQVEHIPQDRRKLVTDHRALGYFANRYGFELVAAVIPAYSTAAEPSPREIAELVDTIRREEVRAIFVGSSVNTAIADRISEDSSVRIVVLYIGTLSPIAGPAETYLEMMKYNVEAITFSLTPSG